jgi:hypothetical protein
MKWLFIAIGVGFGLVLAAMFAPDLFRKRDYKTKPQDKGLNLHWHGKHPPGGAISNIEYYYINENGNRIWKFAECPDEIRAELGEDVVEQEDARSGDGYFIFNRTVQGNIAPWSDPAYAKYFKDKSFLNRIGRLERLKTLQNSEIQDRIHVSPEKIVSDLMDAQYTKHKIIKPIRLLRTKGKWRDVDDMEGPANQQPTESP